MPTHWPASRGPDALPSSENALVTNSNFAQVVAQDAQGEALIGADGCSQQLTSNVSNSTSAWTLLEALPPSPVLLIEDVLREVISWCDTLTKLRLRAVCQLMRFHVDDMICFGMVLASVKSRSRRSLLGTAAAAAVAAASSKNDVPGGGSESNPDGAAVASRPRAASRVFEECIREASADLAEFDFVEDQEALLSSDGMNHTPVVVAAIESERCYPFRGFVKRMLPGDPPPWVYLPGGGDSLRHSRPLRAGTEEAMRGDLEQRRQVLTGLDEVPCPRGFQWVTPWEPRVAFDEGETDEEGWRYALGFAATFFQATPRLFVRRREWRRQMVCDPEFLRRLRDERRAGGATELEACLPSASKLGDATVWLE